MLRIVGICLILSSAALLRCTPNRCASNACTKQLAKVHEAKPRESKVELPGEQEFVVDKEGEEVTEEEAREVRWVGEDWANGIPRSRWQVKVLADGTEIRHGEHIIYWENGHEKLKMYYVDGSPHGPKKSWYEDGAKWSTGAFVNGKEDGVWTIRHIEGTKQQEFHMDHGTMHGMQTLWYPSGQVKYQGRWHRGRQVGVFTEWNEEGNIVRQIDYGPAPETQ